MPGAPKDDIWQIEGSATSMENVGPYDEVAILNQRDSRHGYARPKRPYTVVWALSNFFFLLFFFPRFF